MILSVENYAKKSYFTLINSKLNIVERCKGFPQFVTMREVICGKGVN